MSSLIPLPIDDFLPEILSALKSHDALVLTASPGAGKTTRLPPACLSAVAGKILVLEPRRMAAVAAATRIADENGWQLGKEVGWQVRFDHRATNETRLVFLTEALLARRMVRDPELKDVDLVILDEFHERSLHTDLTLGLLKELRDLGRDLKIIVMSATLAAERIAEYLGGVPVVKVPGKLFELQVEHQKMPQRLRTDHEFLDRVVSAVKSAQLRTKHDLLVFLPGVGDIEKVRERLGDWAAGARIDLVPLHGSLPLEEQRRALMKGARPRIVLSTNIAESSVTVDGVDTVIDSGLAKVNRFDVRTGFSRLELSRISLSSAVQRSGRAARQFPGTSIRLWTKQDEMSMPKDEVPEIQRADLTEALLFLAHQGITDFKNFSWFEAPSAQLIAAAEKVLRGLGALSDGNILTERGRQLLHYPLPPRLAGLLLEAGEMRRAGADEAISIAAEVAAILQERDFVRDDVVRSHIGDQLECDMTLRLSLLERLRPKVILQSAEQIARLASASASASASAKVSVSVGGVNDEALLLRRLLLRAFSDRLCRRRGNGDRAVMVGGRGVKLGPESLVRESEFFLALNGVEGLSESETTVTLACGLDKDFVLKELGHRVERRKDLFVDENKGQVYAREARYFEDLALDEPNLTPATAAQVAEMLPELMAQKFDVVLKRNEALAHWMQRWEFLSRNEPAAAAIVFDPAKLREVFAEASYGEKSLEAAAAKDLVYFFESSVPADLLQVLRNDVPDRLQVPTGNRLVVHYPPDREPYLEVRLQEVFGWTETPKLLRGKVPVVLHLLGPNYRPVQVTANLKSFWENAYPEVRKEMRSRYPKHSWPDDPLTAKPEAKGRPRK